MNSCLKAIVFSFIIFFNTAFLFAYVYVYEITVDNGTFLTISKSPIDTYLIYNGGYDIIKHIKIIDIYDDKNFEKALKDYNIGNNNVKRLSDKKFQDNNSYSAPFIWWR